MGDLSVARSLVGEGVEVRVCCEEREGLAGYLDVGICVLLEEEWKGRLETTWNVLARELLRSAVFFE